MRILLFHFFILEPIPTKKPDSHFLLPKSDKIREKATKLIQKQKRTGIVLHKYCDYAKLEKFCKQWAFDKLEIICSRPVIYVEMNEDVNFADYVTVKNGSLMKQSVNTTVPGIFTCSVSASDEFGQTKSIKIEIHIMDKPE